MEYLHLTNWKVIEETQGGLLFIQKLIEMSFDYTSYIHKGNRPSCRSLTLEIISLADQYNKIEHPSYLKEVDIIKNELQFCLKADPIAKKLIGNKKNQYLSCLENPKDTDILINNMQLLSIKVETYKYLNECIRQIKETIVKQNEKKRIIKLAELFFLACMEGGYQQGTIYYLITRFFFDKYSRKEINSCNDILPFFNYFDLKIGTYSVIFKGSKLFSEVKESCGAFNIEIIEDIKEIVGCTKFYEFCKNRKNNKSFVMCKNINAVDYLAARREAESRMVTLSNILNMFHHKRNVYWDRSAVIKHEGKDNCVLINQPNNPIVNIPDSRIEEANRNFLHIIKEIRLNDNSFKRFNRALGFHSLATKISDPANQLVNLWTCLEILLVGTRKGSKIDLIENDLQSFIVPMYIPYLIDEITRELVGWNVNKLADLVKFTHQARKDENKTNICVAELIALKEHEEVVTEFLKGMDEVPLLRQKLMFLILNLQNSDNIMNILNEFTDRIKWDIRRIYRCRNSIIHAGIKSRNIEMLIEVAHTFLDLVLRNIYNQSAYYKNVLSIENTILENNLRLNLYRQTLVDKRQCTFENYLELLFGPDVQ